MQSLYLLPRSSNPLSPPSLPLSTTTPILSSLSVANSVCVAGLPSKKIHQRPRGLAALHSTAMQEIVETNESESQFVEVGYISGVHGLGGEVRVKAMTEFPELRFSEPGRRWLRQKLLGKDKVQEVELVEGRGHPAKKSWIVKFSNIDEVEQAQQLVGSTILVTEEDKPDLEEDEFYTRDLVGMRVILKDTGEPVGTVVSVFNSGANDLLQVMLNSSLDKHDGTGNPKSEASSSPPLVLIPFVEAIVPNVDMDKREMLITPPKGLLELNLRSDERSKKERRQTEWKEQKKLQKRLIAAKKKLSEMEQKHVFDGFKHGEKAQGRLLADQIISVNSKLLQVALQNIEMPSHRWNSSEFITVNFPKQMRSTYKISESSLFSGGKQKLPNSKLLKKSHLLTSKGKMASVLFVDATKNKDSMLADIEKTEEIPCICLQNVVSDVQRLAKVEDRETVPLILICPANVSSALQDLFANDDHFAFDPQKVWFLEEEKLPVVSSSPIEKEKHKILMKSPWEVLQTPIGSGGVISTLTSYNMLENLSVLGVEYIEVCSINRGYVGRESLLGLVSSSEAHVGLTISHDTNSIEEDFHMIFSMEFMKRLVKQTQELHFCAVPKPNPHVKMVDKEWVDVIPSSPNSFEFRCSIYSSLRACPSDKVCVMEVVD